MGAERSEEEPVGSSRANALAKNSVNDQGRKTNRKCVNRLFSNNRQGSNSRKQQGQRRQQSGESGKGSNAWIGTAVYGVESSSFYLI